MSSDSIPCPACGSPLDLWGLTDISESGESEVVSCPECNARVRVGLVIEPVFWAEVEEGS